LCNMYLIPSGHTRCRQKWNREGKTGRAFDSVWRERSSAPVPLLLENLWEKIAACRWGRSRSRRHRCCRIDMNWGAPATSLTRAKVQREEQKQEAPRTSLRSFHY
jgi:hypothetical protein